MKILMSVVFLIINLSYVIAEDDGKSMICYKNETPSFPTNHFTEIPKVEYSWAQMAMYDILPDEIWILSLRYLHLLVVLAAALGVWTVGNIGRERGPLKWPLIGAFAAYPLRYCIYHESVCLIAVAITISLLFYTFSKQRHRQPKKIYILSRMVIIRLCTCLCLFLWGSYLYHQGAIKDSQGDKIPIYEAVYHVFTSEWWMNYIIETYNFAVAHVWYEEWMKMVHFSGPNGEQNDEELDFSQDWSQQEFTTWHGSYSEMHPGNDNDDSPLPSCSTSRPTCNNCSNNTRHSSMPIPIPRREGNGQSSSETTTSSSSVYSSPPIFDMSTDQSEDNVNVRVRRYGRRTCIVNGDRSLLNQTYSDKVEVMRTHIREFSSNDNVDYSTSTTAECKTTTASLTDSGSKTPNFLNRSLKRLRQNTAIVGSFLRRNIFQKKEEIIVESCECFYIKDHIQPICTLAAIIHQDFFTFDEPLSVEITK